MSVSREHGIEERSGASVCGGEVALDFNGGGEAFVGVGPDGWGRREAGGQWLAGALREGVTDYSELPSLLIQSGYKLTLFKEDEINLETAFMHLTKGITS